MTISNAFELATNAEFKELSNFSLPPRAGRVTAIEPSGQVRVASDDPDGGDVLAWPLNGFTYAVDDVVYILFAGNGSDSAIVLGARSPVPALTVGDPLLANIVRARSAAGLRLEEDAGTLGIFVEDATGAVGIGTDAPRTGEAFNKLTVQGNDATAVAMGIQNAGAGQAAFFLKRTGATPSRWYHYIPAGEDAYSFFNNTFGGNVLKLLSNGRAGFGVDVPQGKLHAHDGTGGMIFVTKTGIVGVAQTIIPNAAGDVTAGFAGLLVASDGSSTVANTLLLTLGASVDVVVGGLTLRFTVGAGGALTVIRQAGAGTASLALLGVWL